MWITYLEMAMKVAVLLVQAGQDIAPFAREVYNKMTSGDEPSDADWALLRTKEKELRDILHVPLPDETTTS